MTLGGYITFGILALCIIGGAVGIALYNADYCQDKKKKATIWIACLLIGVILTAGLFGGMWAWYHKTESGKRHLKSWESNISEGIERRVRVYDVDGELLETYEGRFDIDYNDNRIIFDDQDGRRHIIFYPTGTVIVDEL